MDMISIYICCSLLSQCSVEQLMTNIKVRGCGLRSASDTATRSRSCRETGASRPTGGAERRRGHPGGERRAGCGRALCVSERRGSAVLEGELLTSAGTVAFPASTLTMRRYDRCRFSCCDSVTCRTAVNLGQSTNSWFGVSLCRCDVILCDSRTCACCRHRDHMMRKGLDGLFLVFSVVPGFPGHRFAEK